MLETCTWLNPEVKHILLSAAQWTGWKVQVINVQHGHRLFLGEMFLEGSEISKVLSKEVLLHEYGWTQHDNYSYILVKHSWKLRTEITYKQFEQVRKCIHSVIILACLLLLSQDFQLVNVDFCCSPINSLMQVWCKDQSTSITWSKTVK
jgi:hypothetical protein